jgi:ABC-type multidrug transport system fused ATPase/permease subunit
MSSCVLSHDKMFDRVLRATSLFFEQNPSGRILNRFSSDMDNMDLMLPIFGKITI